MKEVEQKLLIKKLELDQVEIPEDLEERLSKALENRPRSRFRNNWKVRLVVGLMVVMLTGYSFDALAFYGKRLIGYDQVMNGTLQQLNEVGQGQVIGKSYSFKNGVNLSLDGIMLDQNQLLAFYTVKDLRGNIDNINIDLMLTIKGVFGSYLINSSYGKMNDSKTEIKYVASFETPSFFDKYLRLCFVQEEGGKREPGEISFTLDRNKAMGYTLEKDINRTVKVDETKILFKSLLASPTKTVLEGSAQNVVELAGDELLGERFRPNDLEIKLIADGKAVPPLGGGMGTGISGITFRQDYDALPKNLKKLQIELVRFGADHDVNRQIELNKNGASRATTILGQTIQIKKIYETNGDTYVTIATEDSVVLTRVYLTMDGKKVGLQETISDEREKKPDGTIIHTRTLHFPGTGGALRLDVQRMTYVKAYNQVIDVPLN